MKLKVCEIFHSLEGETSTAGFPAVFVRLTGCNLNCAYCDTVYARKNGRDMSLHEILAEVKKYGPVHHVTLTGGEPLLQENSRHLIRSLCDTGYDVQIETNGSISIAELPEAARRIVDVKCPSSGEGSSFLMENLDFLKKGDELKFVLGSEHDYDFARNFLQNSCGSLPVIINLSAAEGKLQPGLLASWILRDGLMVRLNLQLHRIIGLETEKELLS
jgi:7-carboxy-7-deazaguanine synthase